MTKPNILIDNIAFAKKNEVLSGKLALAECPRLLNEFLTGNIHYKLQGESNAVGQHFLHLKIQSNLTTTCQRCLSEMPLNMEMDFTYSIGEINVGDLEAIEIETGYEDTDTIDFQPASHAMDLIALIEDEVMLAMPIAPTHERDCGKLSTQSGEKPNPFAVLKNLIKP